MYFAVPMLNPGAQQRNSSFLIPHSSFQLRGVIGLDAKLYEVLALAMRYFFTFFGLLIVCRSLLWLAKDQHKKHRRLKNLPDAGTIGILTVEAGSRELSPGVKLAVPYEGTLGFLRTCDVVVPVDDVANIHLDFTFVSGRGLLVCPRRGCTVMVDGFPVANARDSREHPMLHGSLLMVGQAVLRLGVFAGLDVPSVPVVAPYAVPQQEDWSPETADVPYGAPGQGYPPYSPDPHWENRGYAPVYPPNSPVNPPYPPESHWPGGDRHAPQ